MRRSRSLLLLACGATAGCTLLTSLEGLSGGPLAVEEGGVPNAEASADATSDAEAGAEPRKKTFLAVLGGENGAVRTSSVYVAQILANGDLGPFEDGLGLPTQVVRGAAVAASNRAYVIGGEDNTRFRAETFSSSVVGAGASWTSSTSALPFGRYRHGAAVSNGRVYVAGGSVGADQPLLSDVLFANVDTTTGALAPWQATTSLPSGLSSAVVLASRGHVYVVSGRAADAGASTSETWSSTIGSGGALAAWTSVLALPSATSSAAGAATDTHLYVCGGYSSGRYDTVYATSVNADGSLASWMTAGAMLTGRAGHAVVTVNDHLYALGGTDPNDVPLSSVELADVRADGSLSTFRASSSLPAARAFHGVVVVTLP